MGVTAMRNFRIGSMLMAVGIVSGVVALAGQGDVHTHTAAPVQPDQTVAAKRPVKDPIKTVTKVVGRAITTVRQVPEIVDRAPHVPAGRIRPCTRGEFVIDVGTILTGNLARSIDAVFSGQFPGQDQAATVGKTLEQLLTPLVQQAFGAADNTTGTAINTTEELLRVLVRNRLLDILFDEAETCPEFVERVVTDVIAELRPETEPPSDTTGAESSSTVDAA
jgi:hypothetical protein